MPDYLPGFPGMKFGADPELFVVDSEGELVCPTFLTGTKDEPEPIKGGALQRDGFAAEFNIDPVDNYEDWEKNFRLVITELRKRIPRGCTLQAFPSMEVSEKVWNEAPDDARVLGCSPDFNAWTGEMNKPPERPEGSRLVTGAGHAHFGWTEGALPTDEQYVAACLDLVKQLDWYLGGWSTLVDKDATRRVLYGNAGAMRFKDYGCEYRVLSNFWVVSTAKRRQVWNRMQVALQAMANSFAPEMAEKGARKEYKFNDRLVKQINTSVIDNELVSFFDTPLRRIYI